MRKLIQVNFGSRVKKCFSAVFIVCFGYIVVLEFVLKKRIMTDYKAAMFLGIFFLSFAALYNVLIKK